MHESQHCGKQYKALRHGRSLGTWHANTAQRGEMPTHEVTKPRLMARRRGAVEGSSWALKKLSKLNW